MGNEGKAESSRRNGQAFFGLLMAISISGALAAAAISEPRILSTTESPTATPIPLPPTPTATIEARRTGHAAYLPFRRNG